MRNYIWREGEMFVAGRRERGGGKEKEWNGE